METVVDKLADDGYAIAVDGECVIIDTAKGTAVRLHEDQVRDLLAMNDTSGTYRREVLSAEHRTIHDDDVDDGMLDVYIDSDELFDLKLAAHGVGWVEAPSDWQQGTVSDPDHHLVTLPRDDLETAL